MKITFWSSTEYSGFLEGLMRELTALRCDAGTRRESGIDARQRFQISEASYRSAKSTPARLFLRFRQYVAYPLQLIAALALQRVKVRRQSDGEGPPNHSPVTAYPAAAGGDGTTQPLNHSTCDDVAVVSTNTFYAPWLATWLHPNVVHLVYDLFPEAMIHSGKWREGSLKVKVVRWITRQTLRRAKTNVFLGQRLKDYVESIHGPVPNSVIIAVGADHSLFGRSPKERVSESEGESGIKESEHPSRISHPVSRIPYPASSPSILYCGNFGNMHDSATLFAYWQRRSDIPVAFDQGGEKRQDGCLPEMAKQCRFYFHCSGPKRAELESVVGSLPDELRVRIHLGGGLSQADWIAAMESADVALVTMAPGAETVVMPSKTYSAMMAGQAILAIAPEDSDLVDLIKAADCGWWVAPGDVDGLAQAVEAVTSDSEALLAKRENAFQYAHAHFGQDVLAREWVAGLCGLGAE